MGLEHVQLHLVQSADDCVDLLRWLSERRESGVVSVDLETGELPGRPRSDALSAYHGRIRLAQIGDENHGWAIPWEDWKGIFYQAMERWEGHVITHNIAFEGKWLTHLSRWDFPWHRVDDTMIAAQIVDPLGSAALKSLTSRYVDRRAAVMQQTLDQAMTTNGWTWGTVPIHLKEYWAYGALDTVLTTHLWQVLRERVEGPAAPFRLVYDLEMATRRICTRMEMNGARVDLDYSATKYKQLHDYADQVRSWAKHTYRGLNIGSNAQLVRQFEKLGVEITTFTPSGQKACDKDQLKMIVRDYAGEAAALAQYALYQRKADKLAETYFANILSDHNDGLIHASIRSIGARTGRMSISSPGPALQTLPKGDKVVRTAFVPREPDHVLLSSDLDQVEFRMTASLARDPGLINLFARCDRDGADAFTEIMREVYRDPSLQKEDPRRRLVKGCVPMDTQILTQRGWLTHDQVVVGDQTLGYDFTTGSTRWTPITGVHRFEDSDIYRLHNRYKSFLCTDDHRWIADGGRAGTRKGFIRASEHPGTGNRIILAAEAEDGPSDITPKEALILGWVLGDGSIKRSPIGGTSQGLDGKRRACRMSLTQTKPHRVAELDVLLEDIPHRRGIVHGRQHYWTLHPDWARDLVTRAGIEGKHDFDPWKLALSLSGKARQAMIDGLDAADGKSSTGVAIVQAADSPVAELCVALGYLTGRYAHNPVHSPDGNGWQRHDCKVIYHWNARFTGQRSRLEKVDHGNVWCVTTELQSWTMRQVTEGNTPVLTGNTVYGKLYGAGISKMALTAGVPEDQMKQVVAAFDANYPGVKTFSAQVEDVGVRRQREEGQAYITTATGRRLPADEGKVYTLVNYAVQGGAAEVFKLDMLKCDAAGLTDYLVVPVHDELVFSVPKDDAEELRPIIKECMTTREGWVVPLTAGVSQAGPNWGTLTE
jgi:DNA polymerase I-like protein with 3'-5' exonuclease and polymerase domains